MIVNDWPDWIITLYLAFPITLIVWLLGLWASWKYNQIKLMTEEVDRILKIYIVEGLPYGVEICDGMVRELLKTSWGNNWKPSKVLEIVDKRFKNKKGIRL